ncbi:MAG TPA: translesion DNA synthesis-associated protein ImuA [Xanthomonadales bacterium]|nr:translesion DNA synthesis-associated protein ImuA [Xanthomonadales bacterium]
MPVTRSPLDQALRLPGVWRARDVALAEAPGVSTGWRELDGKLPGGGWPRGALTELHVPALGVGELSLLAPALAQLSHEARWLAFVDPPETPYAPALAQRGFALERVLVVRTKSARDARWSIEQLVRSGAASAVLAWLPDGDERALRRVHAAAAGGPTLAVCCLAPHAAPRTSPAALRIALKGLGRRRLELDVLKRRGSRIAPFQLDLAAPVDAQRFAQPIPQAVAPAVEVERAPLTERIAALWERSSDRERIATATPSLPELPANVARFTPRPASERKPAAPKPKPAPRAPRLVPRDDDPQYQLL